MSSYLSSTCHWAAREALVLQRQCGFWRTRAVVTCSGRCLGRKTPAAKVAAEKNSWQLHLPRRRPPRLGSVAHGPGTPLARRPPSQIDLAVVRKMMRTIGHSLAS